LFVCFGKRFLSLNANKLQRELPGINGKE